MDLGPHRAHSILKEIPLPLLEDIVCRCEHVSLQPGDVLLSPGQENHTLYFILSGQLKVHLDGRDSANDLPIPAGGIVGEMSIREKQPVLAWVVAAQPSVLLAMPEDMFWFDFVTVPEANRRLMQFLISRVRATNAVLQKELEQKVRYELLKKELESAWKIQANLLPSVRPLFSNPAVDVHPFIRPAREVGGDFFDAVVLDETHLCVAIGDVSGKGMPAALFMVRVVTLLRSAILERKDPASVLPHLNQWLCEANEEFMFVTLAVALIDTSTGRLTYLNAGHNPPLLSVAGGPFRIWDPPKGALLGVAPKAVYESREIILGRGDAMLFYTDGVTEAENSGQEVFGVPRLSEKLEAGGPFHNAASIVEKVDLALTEFVAGADQSDDITMLALRYVGVS